MKKDGRKNNGGPRSGTGPKPMDPGEKKVSVSFQVKLKHVIDAKEKIQPIIDEINKK